jgi:hypothetical protein
MKQFTMTLFPLKHVPGKTDDSYYSSKNNLIKELNAGTVSLIFRTAESLEAITEDAVYINPPPFYESIFYTNLGRFRTN